MRHPLPVTNALSMESITDAIQYAKAGWLVLPVYETESTISDNYTLRCACNESCGRDAGKHPRVDGGSLVATQDTNKIAKWWRTWPNAHIGLATGVRSGVIVIDVDPKNGGFESLTALIKKHGRIPKTLTATTPSGGLHLYFSLPFGTTVYGSTCTLGLGLDVIGELGYVLAPPSTGYSWKKWPEGKDIPEPPEWLLRLVTDPEWFDDNGGPIKKHRNATILAIASDLRRCGLSATESAMHLLAVNEQRCVPPLPVYVVLELVEYSTAITTRPSYRVKKRWWEFWKKDIAHVELPDDFQINLSSGHERHDFDSEDDLVYEDDRDNKDELDLEDYLDLDDDLDFDDDLDLDVLEFRDDDE